MRPNIASLRVQRKNALETTAEWGKWRTMTWKWTANRGCSSWETWAALWTAVWKSHLFLNTHYLATTPEDTQSSWPSTAPPRTETNRIIDLSTNVWNFNKPFSQWFWLLCPTRLGRQPLLHWSLPEKKNGFPTCNPSKAATFPFKHTSSSLSSSSSCGIPLRSNRMPPVRRSLLSSSKPSIPRSFFFGWRRHRTTRRRCVLPLVWKTAFRRRQQLS